MTEQEPGELVLRDRLVAVIRKRRRELDRLRLEYVEAWYTPIGQRGIQMAAGLGLLNVIVFFAQVLF